MLPALECPAATNEACLHVNVWTPAAAALAGDPTPRPVLVFFAGGAFFQGSASIALYDGQFLANWTNSIVVTGDYRLGALGFLVWRNSSGDIPIAGNFGIMDQTMMLEWVRDNIHAFGGDPSNVTLFGQSAGNLLF